MLRLIRVVQVRRLYKTRYFFPVVLWSILIWSLSTASKIPHVPFDFLSLDKLGHLTFYAIETLLLIWGFAKTQEWVTSSYSWIMICMVFAGIYGTSLEFVQAGIPERSFDYADMIANFIGTIVGALIYYKTATKYFLNKII
ncbi:MAG: VanZ family protein [Saprospiraceae bacterium]|nr:VanZ family protein [Saprospiraceae bacterium]